MFLCESDSSGLDQIMVDRDGIVITYASELAAREAAEARSSALSSQDASKYDLDAIETWCESDDDVRDRDALLNAWNRFTDLPRGDSSSVPQMHAPSTCTTGCFGRALSLR